ncbi:hypothetical protein [Wolbachia endosymbiont of Pentalonia nigronervosa]|uniref:hypothetical protein n=1 Tax=Wolbachia endosymbiont of Pentalonia nigronervosa TaxID=1301914 RepID=UPI001CB71E60|nr:hypothetical protein [Wolbachia endosymbiont of Pentalonia nigronervosa]
MNKKIIIPFKGETLSTIKGIGRTNKRPTFAGNLKGLSEILKALEGVSHGNANFVSKINKDKKPGDKETMPFPRDASEKPINFGKGLNYVYGTKPLSNQAEDLNPFASGLKKIKPSERENEKLNWFKSEVVTAKSANELDKVVNQALADGIRINACREGEWSFGEYVILGTHFHKFEKGDLKKIMHELMLKGAEFHERLLKNKLIGEIYNELEKEVQPKIDKQLEELKKAGEKAVQGGTVIDVRIDNKIFFMEFSKDSIVEVAKVVEGTKNLGLNNGLVKLGSNIIKMGNSEVEVKSEQGGKRNYVGMSDGSDVIITFRTSIGELNIRMCHDDENQVLVKVEDKEKWAELKKKGEVVGKNSLFGGMTVKEAVEIGSFTRCGMWSKEQVTEQIKEASENSASETLSWVDRTRVDSKETSRQH